MAIDQTNVALNIASQIVNQTQGFLDAYENLADLLTWATDAGINMTNYDDDLAASGDLKHVDGATINKVNVIIPAMASWLAAQSTGGSTYEEILYSIRKA